MTNTQHRLLFLVPMILVVLAGVQLLKKMVPTLKHHLFSSINIHSFIFKAMIYIWGSVEGEKRNLLLGFPCCRELNILFPCCILMKSYQKRSFHVIQVFPFTGQLSSSLDWMSLEKTLSFYKEIWFLPMRNHNWRDTFKWTNLHQQASIPNS